MRIEEKLWHLIRAEIDSAAQGEFARLRSIPSTYTWKAVDYVSGLDADRRAALFDAFASRAMSLFFPDHNPMLHPGQSGNASHREFTEAMPLLFDSITPQARWV